MTAVYTDDMRRALHSLKHYNPPGFGLTIAVDDVFINVIMDAEWLLTASDYDRRRSIEYTMKVINAFESLGAMCQLLRLPIKNDK